jgi:2-succinyl-5-enolpyruvyl-6-hydroxy-3-cyclohexene-1-carboxylate synthase
VSAAEASFACAWALVDELVRGGVRYACVSPGSRSTPLALALTRHPEVTVRVHLDERSSAFFALGLAKALGEPVAVACTSGTAAAEFFPAVVEASQSRVPLILLTADRPPRLRGTGANQTIDQVELYGGYVRAYLEVPVPTHGEDRQRWASAGREAMDASSAVIASTGETTRAGGPVHVNCPVDEPLTPRARDLPEPVSTPEGSRPRVRGPDPIGRLLRSIDGNPVLLAGPMSELDGDIVTLAAILQIPLIADALSGGRRPATHTASGLGAASAGMTAGTALLESDAWLRTHMPDSVLLLGGAPTSRAAQRLIGDARRVVVVHDGHLDPTPDRPDAVRIRRPPALVARIGAGGEYEGLGPVIPWLAAWREADAAARTAIDGLLDSWSEASEMRVARDLAAAIPDGGTLFVGNSMPVRDLDAYMAPRDGLRVLANRGASGIDGLLSTALGIATSGTGPVVALLGDLSFLYDAGALLWNARRGIDIVVVVNDNGGGQIFAGLGQGELPADELERLFVTPHVADIEHLCRASGAGHASVDRADDLVPALASASAAGGLQVVQVAIDADRDRARRAELRTAVADALDRLDPG